MLTSMRSSPYSEKIKQCSQEPSSHIYDNFMHLVTDNLQWWYNGGYMHQSRDAIREKFGGNDNSVLLALLTVIV